MASETPNSVNERVFEEIEKTLREAYQKGGYSEFENTYKQLLPDQQFYVLANTEKILSSEDSVRFQAQHLGTQQSSTSGNAGSSDGTGQSTPSNNGKALNMREDSNLNANVITTIPNGTEIKNYNEQGEWTKVEINGKQGWVMSKYLKKTSDGRIIVDTSDNTDDSNESFISFSNTAVDALKNNIRNLYYKESEKNTLLSDINGLYNNTMYIGFRVSAVENSVMSNLNPETKTRLGDLASLFQAIRDKNTNLKGMIENSENALRVTGKKASSEDADDRAAAQSRRYRDTGHSSGSGSDGGSESATPGDVPEETPTPTPTTPENESLVAAAVGAVTFAEIVPMYTALGEDTTENSATTTTYGLLGVEKYNEKYYYKIIDKTTGKIYYVEKEKANYEGDASDVLEVKNTTIRYVTAQLDNEDNNAKVISDGSYFVLGEETVTEGEQTFTFAKVLDSTDGKTYFVQKSDNVELTPIASLGTGSEE